MFGYRDSNHCISDIWSPNPTRWGDNAIENRAFSPYCKHIQECEDIIQMILAGGTNFELDDDFGQSDLDYINSRLREYGISANLSLS